MTIARAAFITITILLAALVAGAYYYYQNLPALVQQQARQYLADYGVEHVSYDTLSISREQLSAKSVRLSGTYEGLDYTVALSSLSVSFNWRSALSGQIDAVDIESVDMSLFEQEVPQDTATTTTLELSEFLPAPYLSDIPLNDIQIRQWTLRYHSQDSPAIVAQGSFTLGEQVQLELISSYQNMQIRGNFSTQGRAQLPVAQINLAQADDHFAQLTMALNPPLNQSWDWSVTGRVNYAPLLAWFRSTSQDWPATLTVDANALDALIMDGHSQFDATLSHPEAVRLVDENGELSYSQFKMAAQTRNQLLRLDYPAIVTELAGEFDLAADFSAGSLALTLGPTELRAKVSAQVLAIPADTRAWLQWDEAVELLWRNPEPASLSPLVGGDWSLQLRENQLLLGNKLSQIRLDTLSLEASLNADAVLRLNGELKSTAAIRLRNEHLPQLQVAVSTSGTLQQNAFHLSSQDLAESMRIQLHGDADLTTGAGHYRATVDSQDLAYAASTVIPLLQKFTLLSKRTALEISGGSMTLESELLSSSFDFDEAMPSSKLSIVNLSGNYDEYSFEGLGLNAQWQGLETLQAKTPIQLTMDKLDIGFDLNNTRLDLSLPELTPLKKPVLNIEVFSSQLFGGRVFLPQPYQWNFAANSNSFTVRAEDWRLADMVALQHGQDISAQGILEGELPVTMSDGRIIIENGFLRALAPGGSIRYIANESSVALAKSSSELALALDLLSDFQYEVLSSKVELDKAGNLLLGLSLAGKNPALFDGRAVNFNINLEQNLDPLLQSLRLSDKLVEQLEGRIK